MALFVLLVLLAIGLSGTAIALDSPLPAATPSDPNADPTSADFSLALPASTSTITNDPSTWPGDESDPIWKCCHAIAYAEGYNVAGSNPFRENNPGDISDFASTFGSEQHSGSAVTDFPDASTGWQDLFNKVSTIVNGGSSVYSPNMTWTQIAQKWAGNWQAWVNNVTRYCGVNPSDRFGDFFGV